MRGVLTTFVAIAAVGASANAYGDNAATEQQVVVVNAAAKLGSLGQIARLRRVLDSRNMLVELPARLEATLDGRNALIADVDAIREAYASADYETALQIIETDEARILGEAANRDPTPAFAELSQWRGIIAATLNRQDEALEWFRATYRFNPAWVIDKKLVSPRVRSLVKRAKREPEERGTLLVDGGPDDAKVSIDGGAARPAGKQITLPVGKHLVMVTAPKRKPHAKLVDIADGETYRIDISLDKESKLDRAARLVDATAAAPAGRPRFKRAGAIAKLTGVSRLLVIEDGSEARVKVRLYDVGAKKVSQQLEFDDQVTSAAIAREISAALDPDNLVDIDAMASRAKPWYGRWYVWAAVGVVAVGSYAGYEYMTREPTAVRGF